MARETQRSGARPSAGETQRSGARPSAGETQRRSRWQLTTRSRFALVLGLAGLAVAGVQVSMLSDPPTVIQIVVVAFWGLVGFGYLLSAAATWLRERRRPAPAPAAPAPVEEIVPVPVRPARPRPRREEAAPAEGAARTEAVRPPAREGHAARDREAPEPAERAARTEAVHPAAARPEPARTEAVRPPVPPRPAPARPEPARTEAVRPPVPTPARPTPARPTPAPAASRVVTRVRRPERPDPAPEPTTVAFRNGAAAAPTGSRPATAMVAGGGSSLSFGAGTGSGAGPASRSTRPDPLDPSTPVRVLAELPVDAAPAPRAPSPISGPLSTAGARASGGRRHAAEDTDSPAPRRARHRADVEDPVAARRGIPAPNSGRHASVGHAAR